MKAGRPIGGRLTPDDKQKALDRAREATKVWKEHNPDKQQEYLKRYKAKEHSIDLISVLQKFIRHIKEVSIN